MQARSAEETTNFPTYFVQIKKDLTKGHEEAIIASWKEILDELAVRTKTFGETGPEMVPQVEFASLPTLPKEEIDRIRRVGSVVIRNIVDDEEARSYKTGLEDYAKANPHVDGFPEGNKQFFEIYWSTSQLRARSHPNVMASGTWLNNLWSASPDSVVDLNTNLAYADRFRIRKPSKNPWLAHTPHIDGAGTERWQDSSLASTYGAILRGDWKHYDPYDITGRLAANTDMYDRPNQASIFRSWQGWLAMNKIAPGNGHLRVFPDLLLQNSYIMLRPFFKPIDKTLAGEAYLGASNWKFDVSEPDIPGIAVMPDGNFTGLRPDNESHPHLRLDTAIVSMPRVMPGDMVFWHCDVIHSVEQIHEGPEDSSVMYIPAVPLTPMNVRYLVKHRAHFEKRHPPPDFPQGTIGGESGFVNKGKDSDITSYVGRLAMGMEAFKVEEGARPGAKEAVKIANEILGKA